MWTKALWDHHSWVAVQWGIVMVAALLGALIDIRSNKIPNRLSGPVLLAGLLWSGLAGGLAGVADSLCAILVLAAPFVFLFLVGGGGAGDAKMMGALGAWLGLYHGLFLLGAVVLSGALLGLGFSLLRRQGRLTCVNLKAMVGWLPWLFLGPGRLRERAALWPAPAQMVSMPYGVAIFAGSCLAALGVCLWRS